MQLDFRSWETVMGKWDPYYQAIGVLPNLQVVQAVRQYTKHKRTALDLGAGNLRDSMFLQKEGFGSVVAVDAELPPSLVPGIESIQSPLEHYMPMPNTFDIVVCCNTLCFFPEDMATRIIIRAYNALAEGGLFVCNLLGDKDEWVVNNQRGVFGHTRERVSAIFSGFESKQIGWRQGMQRDAYGNPKFWDLCKVTVQKT